MIDFWQNLRDKRDRLKQLRAFCHAARLGSISRATEQVMASQPAGSLQVCTLEEELGVPLFERRGPRISLTVAGQSLYRLAMPLVVGHASTHYVTQVAEVILRRHGVAPYVVVEVDGWGMI